VALVLRAHQLSPRDVVEKTNSNDLSYTPRGRAYAKAIKPAVHLLSFRSINFLNIALLTRKIRTCFVIFHLLKLHNIDPGRQHDYNS
jgi:hypothetical protein